MNSYSACQVENHERTGLMVVTPIPATMRAVLLRDYGGEPDSIP